MTSLLNSLQGIDSGKPVRLHIGGEGGTGKSRVVQAIRELAASWTRPGAIQTVAQTGIAAALIQGETVHKFLRSNAQSQRHGSLKVSEEDRIRFSQLHMLIWDEVSMTSKELLGKAMQNLNLLLGTSHRKQCRVHIVTLGDFF